LWGIDDEFLLGEALLAAPVYEEGATARDIVLPRGRWYSFWNEAVLEGPLRACVDTPLERIPLFVRAGSILPTEEADALTLHLYAPAEDDEHTGQLYCDAGDGYGDALLNRFSLRRAGQSLALAWEREGAFAFPYASVEIRAHGASVARAVVDGAEADCHENVVRLGGPCAKVILELSAG
jgi:alpha-glucosidase